MVREQVVVICMLAALVTCCCLPFKKAHIDESTRFKSLVRRAPLEILLLRLVVVENMNGTIMTSGLSKD